MARDNCFAKTKVVEIHKGECLKSEDDDKTEEIQWVLIVISRIP